MGTGQPQSINLLSVLPNLGNGGRLSVGHQGTREDNHECAEPDGDAQLASHTANSSVPKGRQDRVLPPRPYRRPMALERRLFDALGGECEIYAVDLPMARLAVAESWVHEMHDRLTRFSPTSELSRFNASAGAWADVSPLLESLLRECLRAHDLSGGLVNAAVLPALLAAGYTRTFSDGPTQVTASVVPPALPEVLEARSGSARLRQGASIDLGGIAKGWLADRLAADLGANTLVNLCGDLYARGGAETGDGWPVGMGGKTVLLLDMGAATSGTRKRSWGADLHHLIDPRTGLPSRSDLTEASVVARTGADAEIFAKTALLLGAAKAEEYLAAHDALGWSLTA